MKAIT